MSGLPKAFDMEAMVQREGGESVLGLRDLNTHACYLIMGVLAPDQGPRLFKPGDGHEEIFYLISGGILLKGEDGEITLQAGQAFHLKGEESFEATALGPGEARYVAAGGHSDGGHHHH